MEEKQQDKPQCTVIKINEPNFELMAKAFLNLYYQTKNSVRVESV